MKPTFPDIRLTALPVIAAALMLFSSCALFKPFEPPASAALHHPEILGESKSVQIRHGGFGSAIARVPGEDDQMYLLTDRGPNFNTATKGQKGFPVPDYTPTIGRFRVTIDGLELLEAIRLKDPDGNLISGLPNPAGMGATGETAVNVDGLPLVANDPYGLDSEGLVALADGTFWISDEYGPHMVHFDRDGRELERINPFGTGTGGRSLPKVFATRRANRGMEGLAITNDGRWLVGIMQSTMYNPKKDTKTLKSKSPITRILFFNIASGATRQYVYIQEAPGLSNSEILAIPGYPDQFLVIERDGRFLKHPDKPAKYKRVYRIDISGATDISDPADSETGKLVKGKTIEQLYAEGALAAAGIAPVTKSLLIDLLERDYPHEKAEGLAIFNATTLIVGNDDDFGVTSSKGRLSQKILPATGQVDTNTLYYYTLDRPLF